MVPAELAVAFGLVSPAEAAKAARAAGSVNPVTGPSEQLKEGKSETGAAPAHSLHPQQPGAS